VVVVKWAWICLEGGLMLVFRFGPV